MKKTVARVLATLTAPILTKTQQQQHRQHQQQLNDIDDRIKSCHEDLQALGVVLRATAARALAKARDGASPLHAVQDDITLVTKVDRLRASSKLHG